MKELSDEEVTDNTYNIFPDVNQEPLDLSLNIKSNIRFV